MDKNHLSQSLSSVYDIEFWVLQYWEVDSGIQDYSRYIYREGRLSYRNSPVLSHVAVSLLSYLRIDTLLNGHRHQIVYLCTVLFSHYIIMKLVSMINNTVTKPSLYYYSKCSSKIVPHLLQILLRQYEFLFNFFAIIFLENVFLCKTQAE